MSKRRAAGRYPSLRQYIYSVDNLLYIRAFCDRLYIGKLSETEVPINERVIEAFGLQGSDTRG